MIKQKIKTLLLLWIALNTTACLTTSAQLFTFSDPTLLPSESTPTETNEEPESEPEPTPNETDDTIAPSEVSTMEFIHTGLTLRPGQKGRLILKNVYLENGVRYRNVFHHFQTPYGSPQTVQWESGDTTVVTVDEAGYLKGKNTGTALVSAKLDDVYAFAEITVRSDSPSLPPPDPTPDADEDEDSETPVPDDSAETPATPEAPNFPETGFLNSNDVITYTIGDKGGFGEQNFPQVLHGAPKVSRMDVLSLGIAGSVTIELRGFAVLDGEGPDFTVFENAFAGWFEPAYVEVSADGETYVEFDCDPETYSEGCAGVTPINHSADLSQYFDAAVSGGDTYDLATVGLDSVRFIRITDAGICTNPVVCVANTAGFDLDGLAILNGFNIP